MEIYTLVLEAYKRPDDGLPEGASSAAFVVFAPAEDPDQAVRDAVNLFRSTGVRPFEVTNFGSMEERQDEGYEFSEHELALSKEALESDAIIILDKQIYYDADDDGERN